MASTEKESCEERRTTGTSCAKRRSSSRSSHSAGSPRRSRRGHRSSFSHTFWNPRRAFSMAPLCSVEKMMSSKRLPLTMSCVRERYLSESSGVP
jgi:hypothetical protein